MGAILRWRDAVLMSFFLVIFQQLITAVLSYGFGMGSSPQRKSLPAVYREFSLLTSRRNALDIRNAPLLAPTFGRRNRGCSAANATQNGRNGRRAILVIQQHVATTGSQLRKTL